MSQQHPLISIIIPSYNRPERLAMGLEAINQLDYPRDRFEVIVVDDGSVTPLDPVVEKFQAVLSIYLIRQENAGPASARNTGANAAQGDYLAFTDDDCQPDSQWLRAIEKAIAEFPNAIVGGQTINALADNLYSSASQLLIDYLYEYYNQTQGKATFFTSNNFTLPRFIYQQLEGFNTNFPLAAGEDREFCDRALNCGFFLHYAPTMKVYHHHFLNLKSFWRQHFNYGRGAFYFHQVRSERQGKPMKVEPIIFYFRLLAYPLLNQKGYQSVIFSGLFLLSQIANVAGFFWETKQQQSLLKVTETTS